MQKVSKHCLVSASHQLCRRALKAFHRVQYSVKHQMQLITSYTQNKNLLPLPSLNIIPSFDDPDNILCWLVSIA